MLLSNHVESVRFIRLSTIVSDLVGEFRINDYEFYEMFNSRASWTFGDANRTLIDVTDFTEVLDDILTALGVSEFDIETYIGSSMQFLQKQGAYIDIEN